MFSRIALKAIRRVRCTNQGDYVSRCRFRVPVACLLLGSFALPACATVSATQERSVERVLSRKPVVQARTPLLLYLKEPARWNSPEQISVTVYEQIACEDGVRETVATERLVTRETKNVAIEAVLGGALTLAGGILLLSSPTLSDTQEPGSDESTPRDKAQLWGVLAGLGGLALMGHAGIVGMKGGSELTNRTVSTRFRTSGSPPRPCGTHVAGPGVVLAIVDDRSVPLARPSSGEALTIEPRAAAADLCSNPADEGTSAKIVYISRGQVHLRVDLARYPMKACVIATVGEQKLSAADAVLSRSASIAETVAALGSLATVEEATQRLPARDPSRNQLVTRLASVKDKGQRRARELREEATRNALDAIRSNIRGAMPAMTLALELASFADHDGKTWSVLYEAFVREAKRIDVEGYGLLIQLLDHDRATADCHSRGQNCPPGVTQKQAQELLAPVAVAAAKPLQDETARLREATSELRKRIDAKSVLRADAAIAHAEPLNTQCSRSDPLGAINDACGALLQANRDLSSALAAESSRVTELRREAETAEEKKRLARVSTIWRRHFNECRRLWTAAEQLDSLSTCDSACQVTRSRMLAEAKRLESFHVDEPINDDGATYTLRQECKDAHCDVCP